MKFELELIKVLNEYYFLVIFLLLIVSIYTIFLFRRKKNYISRFFFPLSSDVLIQEILYIFSYASLHKKNIIIYFFDKTPVYLFDDFIHLKTLCSKKNIRFLLHNNSSYFIFFICYNGIIEYIIHSKYEIDFSCKFGGGLVKIINNTEYNYFDIQTEKYFLKENNINKTVHILKSILQERNI